MQEKRKTKIEINWRGTYTFDGFLLVSQQQLDHVRMNRAPTVIEYISLFPCWFAGATVVLSAVRP